MILGFPHGRAVAKIVCLPSGVRVENETLVQFVASAFLEDQGQAIRFRLLWWDGASSFFLLGEFSVTRKMRLWED